MKKLRLLIIGFFFLQCANAFCQAEPKTEISAIEPFHLNITYSKTTHLLFPFAIISIDRGSKDILAQKAKGVDNVLQIKAAKQGFDQTNLTVITADGKLYSYLVDYLQNPSILNLQVKQSDQLNNRVLLDPEHINEAEIHQIAQKVVNLPKTVHGIKDKRYDMRFFVNGIFISRDVMYYQLKIANNSNITYDIDQLRFFIRDQKKAKRTAIQEIELKPLYLYNDTTSIKGKSAFTFVYAMPKQTIPNKKYLAIELLEKDGGRYLHLDIYHKTLEQAKDPDAF